MFERTLLEEEEEEEAGKSVLERDVTAKMLFRVVRGSWGRPASRAALRKVEGEGMVNSGCQGAKPEEEGLGDEGVVARVVAARTRPRMKTSRA